ncbi:hypothetical protein I4U23_021343 [Adineta vaga]|nr:hypothetical protein I4U23_021343 [Adineta vaga]
MRQYLLIFKTISIKRQMASLANTVVDIKVGTKPEDSNPAVVIPQSMVSFIDNEKINLKQIASNFVPRHFEFRTKDRTKKINVVQLMSEYDGNFSTPVCYLRFYLKRAGKFIRFAEELGTLSSGEEIHRLNCIRIYKDFIQRYTDIIGAIQTYESECNGRLFRRSIERMKPEIAHVPMNLHLQQLLVSSGDDPSQKAIYNTVTLGAPAVHHSRFSHGGLRRMKANIIESNKRLRFLQEKLQDVLILNSDIEDALDHLTHILESPSTNVERSVLRLSLQRVVKAVSSLLEYSTKDLDTIANSTGQVIINPLISRVPTEEVSQSNETIQDKARKLTEEIKQSMNKDEQTFGKTQLNNLKLIADELERHTCKHIIRYIFQENMEIERYPEVFRERFDIAFSQALTCLIFSVYVLLSSVKISDQAWKLYINNGLLMSFEYLLTCDGDELGMLEDSVEAIHALEHVHVRFVPATANNDLLQPRFFGTRFYCKVVIPLPVAMFAKLPQELKDGGSIRIVPVVFNIGINERALAARVLTLNLFSTTQVESDLNHNNLDKLKAFINKSLNYLPEDIPDLLKQLEHSIRSNKPKNVHIFPLAEKICRRAYGVRVTGCKSAKDRTSMGFTLEQGQLLLNNHNVDKHDLQEILNQFRCNGTSIENALANTGCKAYAFSYFQLLTFPEHYRAQQGTYGDVQT